MTGDERFLRARKVAVEVFCIGAILAPLVVCVASGLVHASLWLDEITYYYAEDDLALRAAELGRPGSPVAPHLGVFFYCDVQRVVHAIVRPLGLTFERDPELALRLLSILSVALAALALYAALRRDTGSRRDALLGALAFGSLPLVLHYAFEARVYALTTMLVILTGIAVERAARRPSATRLAVAASLGLVTAHAHLWTLCFFAALLGAAALRAIWDRRLEPWTRAAAAAALPALALAAAEVLYMRATDPGAPLFPPFQPQPAGLTFEQLVLSNFLGVAQTQFLVRSDPPAYAAALAGSAALITLALLSLRPKAGDTRRGLDWSLVALGGLFACGLLAVGYGYYTHARYHVPLMGAFFFAVSRAPSRTKRLVLSLVVVCNLALLPATIEAVSKKGNARQIARLIEGTGTRDVSVVCQHVLSGMFPLPLQAVGLDFYLNVLHPGERPIPIREKPDLALVNGRRGVYDLFAGGSPVLEEYLASKPAIWRRKRDELGPLVFVLEPVWNVGPGDRQNRDFAAVMLEAGDRVVTGKYFVLGFPQTRLVELRTRPRP